MCHMVDSNHNRNNHNNHNNYNKRDNCNSDNHIHNGDNLNHHDNHNSSNNDDDKAIGDYEMMAGFLGPKQCEVSLFPFFFVPSLH